MIRIAIQLEENHISTLHIEGHAQLFEIEEKAFSIKEFFSFDKKNKAKLPNQGSIPCAAISVLAKSFVESIIVYAKQRKAKVEDYLEINTIKEGELLVALMKPNNDPLHIHRYAIEQMLIIGIQAVAKEYTNDIELNIKSNKN